MESDDSDMIGAARSRIARQRGRLTGWRPYTVGDGAAVMALEVLGDVRDVARQIGLRVAVAQREALRDDPAIDAAVEMVLRKRAVLGATDPFIVERRGAWHNGNGEESDDSLTWPWRFLVFHVPLERLPAIAGLATDAVPLMHEERS